MRLLAISIMRKESDQRILRVVLTNSNYQGMCFAMWLDPAKVPDVAEDLMSDAGHTFPLLLANRVRARCCDRMGRRFDTIMKRMPQVTIISYFVTLFNSRIVHFSCVLLL